MSKGSTLTRVESISIGSDEDSIEPFTLSTAISRLAVGSANSSPPNLTALTETFTCCYEGKQLPKA